MANNTKSIFLDELRKRFGKLRKLELSQSLYEVDDGRARIYIRYSKVHGSGKTFYGLRQQDLKQLEGISGSICFLWPDQTEPLFIPYADYEEVFRTVSPAKDGQFKVQLFLDADETELYIARAGRFNVEGHLGWESLESVIGSGAAVVPPDLSHSQLQTILGAIGASKSYDIWIPQQDRDGLDWSISSPFECRRTLPDTYRPVKHILEQIDVVWFERGSSAIGGLYEVEHTTPVYPGLLRFNDIHLAFPNMNARFVIVGDHERRRTFSRQLNRPTFLHSKLADLCTFLEYGDAYRWYLRLRKGEVS